MSGHGLSPAAVPHLGLRQEPRASWFRDASATFSVQSDPADVMAARRAVVQAVREWRVPLAAERLAELELLASEVVTNAVRYSRTECVVEVRWAGTRVRVEVTDRCRELPVRGGTSPETEGGRGLVLVEALATRWGTTTGSDGKVVWFEVAVPGAGQRMCQAPAAVANHVVGARRRMHLAPTALVPAVAHEGTVR